VKKLFGIIAATVLAFAGVATIAPAPDASATTKIYYECQKYNWFFGWRYVRTTDYFYYQDRGWTCYCIGTIEV
jgi:hypothetical protein